MSAQLNSPAASSRRASEDPSVSDFSPSVLSFERLSPEVASSISSVRSSQVSQYPKRHAIHMVQPSPSLSKYSSSSAQSVQYDLPSFSSVLENDDAYEPYTRSQLMFDRIEERETAAIELSETNWEVRRSEDHQDTPRYYRATLVTMLRHDDPEPKIQVREMFDYSPERYVCSAAACSKPKDIWTFEGWRMKRYRISIPLNEDTTHKARNCEVWLSREGDDHPSATLPFTIDHHQLPRDVTDFVSRDLTRSFPAGPSGEFQTVCLRTMLKVGRFTGDRPMPLFRVVSADTEV